MPQPLQLTDLGRDDDRVESLERRVVGPRGRCREPHEPRAGAEVGPYQLRPKAALGHVVRLVDDDEANVVGDLPGGDQGLDRTDLDRGLDLPAPPADVKAEV